MNGAAGGGRGRQPARGAAGEPNGLGAGRGRRVVFDRNKLVKLAELVMLTELVEFAEFGCRFVLEQDSARACFDRKVRPEKLVKLVKRGGKERKIQRPLFGS
jgi:hypothetical protein